MKALLLIEIAFIICIPLSGINHPASIINLDPFSPDLSKRRKLLLGGLPVMKERPFIKL